MSAKPQPKALLICPYRFIPPKNGGHNFLFDGCHHFDQHMDFICLGVRGQDKSTIDFRLEDFFSENPLRYISPLVAWKLYRYLQRNPQDLVIMNQPFPLLIMLPALLLLKFRSATYVHNLEYKRFRDIGKWWWPLMHLMEKIAYRLSHHLFFVSIDEIPVAIQQFGLKPAKCIFAPQGKHAQATPPPDPIPRQKLQEMYGLTEDEKIILFSGPLTYLPNMEAVEGIIQQLAPILSQRKSFKHRILICGGGLPPSYDGLKAYEDQHIHYLGFVDDIELHIKASDIILNPIAKGGGAKSKVTEAVSLGKTVLSFESGAEGFDKKAFGPKLIVVDDYDYPALAEQIIQVLSQPEIPTPASFYQVYFWGNTAAKVAQIAAEPNPS